MSLLMSLSEIIERCIKEHEILYQSECTTDFFLREVAGGESKNILTLGENEAFMRWLLLKGSMKGQLKFIYLDPPFFSGSNYSAEVQLPSEKMKLKRLKAKVYKDTWQSGMEEFLTMLTRRLLLMKDLLAEDGSIVLHLDWHAVHYAKVVMDELFGEKNFVNEIIWTYKSGGVSSRSFSKKHDTLLFYSKSRHYYFSPQKEKSYNRGYKPYRFKGVKEYKDENGWYTMVNKRDVFNLDMVGRTSAERTGYATQKPESLIETLLESCTREGDLCGDFFVGSGTFPAVAHRMKRRFIACDSNALALATTRKRLYAQHAEFAYMDSLPEEDMHPSRVRAMLRPEETASEEVLWNVRLEEYECDINLLPISTEDKKLLKKLQGSDPLVLVDYWCIDSNFDGMRFQASSLILREKGVLPVESSLLGKEGRRIAIKVYDVFGGCGILVKSI